MPFAEISQQTATVPVSVVIPCYRHAEVLRRAIASVAAQTVLPSEVIVVNDGGGDEVGKTLRRLQDEFGASWLLIIDLAFNRGAGEARNAGWAAARGDYIAFLDADDAWHPRKIEIQYAFMRSRPDIVVSGHRHRRESIEARWADYDIANARLRQPGLIRWLSANQFVTPSAMIKRRTTVRFAPGQRYMEDFRLWLTFIARGERLVKLDAELACTFKAPFGNSGLSADLLKMEIGELRTYWSFCTERMVFFPLILLLAPYSLLKFARRYLLLLTRRRFPGAN